jgi:hypothetical protein
MNELMVLAGLIFVVSALMMTWRPARQEPTYIAVVRAEDVEQPNGNGCLPIIVAVLLGLLFIGWLA